MRFIPRAATGAFMMLISVSLIGAGVWRLTTAAPEAARSKASSQSLPQVTLHAIETTRLAPSLSLQGRIQAARETRLSFAVSGRLDSLSEQLKTGLKVAQGEVIAQLDTREFQRNLRNQELNLNSARADLVELASRAEAARIDIAQAQAQVDLRAAQVERLKGLERQQLASLSDIETAELSLNSAQQALSAKRLALINAEAASARGELEVERLSLALERAQQDLADATLRAPFDGVLTQVSVKPGDQVNAGQSLAVLTDLTSLEVAFSTQNPRVIRLLQPDAQAPLPLPTQVTLTSGSLQWVQNGQLSRVASSGELADGGRQLFATLDPIEQTLLRPGDWVQVEVTEPERDDVSWIPISALTDDEQIFTLDQDRLRAISVEVLQRDGTRALIEKPASDSIVAEVAPRFADGLPVQLAGAR